MELVRCWKHWNKMNATDDVSIKCLSKSISFDQYPYLWFSYMYTAVQLWQNMHNLRWAFVLNVAHSVKCFVFTWSELFLMYFFEPKCTHTHGVTSFLKSFGAFSMINVTLNKKQNYLSDLAGKHEQRLTAIKCTKTHFRVLCEATMLAYNLFQYTKMAAI